VYLRLDIDTLQRLGVAANDEEIFIGMLEDVLMYAKFRRREEFIV